MSKKNNLFDFSRVPTWKYEHGNVEKKQSALTAMIYTNKLVNLNRQDTHKKRTIAAFDLKNHLIIDLDLGNSLSTTDWNKKKIATTTSN